MNAQNRWAQFSYASFGSGELTGSGGWNVGFRSAGLTETELQGLRKFTVSSYNEQKLVLPQFPTPEDLASRPRWMSYHRAEGDGVYVHAVPAGLDASQRPQNVFNHVLIDRAPEPGELRPIMLWGAPVFQSPYGADAVQSVQLSDPPAPLAPGGVSRDTAIAFLESVASSRPDLLAVLLDAVRAAVVHDGPRVVLATDSSANAAHWLAAVSMLTTPEWSRKIEWSLFQFSEDVLGTAGPGVHFTAVPRSELADLGADSACVVIDEASLHSVDEEGQSHVTAAGHRVEISAWSRIAIAVLRNSPGGYAAVSDIVDEIGANGISPHAAPEWPLAIAALHADVPGAAAVVAATIEHHTPFAVETEPWLMRHVVTVISEDVGADASAAYQRLMGAAHAQDSLGYALLYRGYLVAAFGDPEWQFTNQGIPLPGGEMPSLGAEQQLTAAAHDALLRETGVLERATTPEESLWRSAAVLDASIQLGLLGVANQAAFTPDTWLGVGSGGVELAQAAAVLTHRFAAVCAQHAISAAPVVAHFAGIRDLVVAGMTTLPYRADILGVPGAQDARAALLRSFCAGTDTPAALQLLDASLRAERALDVQPRVPAFLYELASHQLSEPDGPGVHSRSAAVVLHGAAERQETLAGASTLLWRDAAAELPLLTSVERVAPGWIPSALVLKLAFEEPSSEALSLFLQRRARYAMARDQREADALHARITADAYLAGPMDTAWLSTFTARYAASLALLDERTQSRVTPNMAVFVPARAVSMAYSELFSSHVDPAHAALTAAEILHCNSEALIATLVTRILQENTATITSVAELLFRSVLLSEDEATWGDARTQAAPAPLLGQLRVEPGQTGKRARPVLVSEAVLRALLSQEPAVRASLESLQATLEQRAEEKDSNGKRSKDQSLRLAQRRLAQILGEDGNHMLKLMHRVNPFGKGN